MDTSRDTLPPRALRAIHREILTPSFPADELYPEQAFVDACLAGELVLVTRDDERGPVAVAVGRPFEQADALLLVWLAVRPGVRGGGHGRTLLLAALERWQGEFAPRLVLGEIERPGTPVADEAHGDPQRRLAFYESLGVRALDVPHLQPPYSPGGAVVESLLLAVFRDEGRAPGESVPAAPVRGFTEAYLAGFDGLPGRVLPAVDALTADGRLATRRLTAAEPSPGR